MQRIPVALVLTLLLLGCESADRPERNARVVAPDAAEQVSSLPLKRLTAGPFLEATVPNCPGLNPAQVPPITTFEWQTIDGVADPDSVRWILLDAGRFGDDWNNTLDHIRNNPDAPEWHPWRVYDPASETNTSWVTPPLDFGRYVFAVHGRTTGSPASQDFVFSRNAIRVLVSARTTGPLVTLTSGFMDPIISASPNTPPRIVELPGGTPVSFCWTGDASAYCGAVRTYRYGWDILDLSDDSQWDVGLTPFDGSEVCSPPRTFSFGTHSFIVEVYDNSGFVTRIPVTINLTGSPVMASLDIRPGSCPNPLNPRSKGVLGVALLGSGDFDVRDVDTSTLGLREFGHGAEGAKPGQSRIWDATTHPSGGTECACPDEGADGFEDLHLKFRTEDVVAAMRPAVKGDVVRLVLEGLLTDGTPFIAVDCARIVGFQILGDEPPPTGPDTRITHILNTYFIDGGPVQEFINIGDAVPDTVPDGSWITLFYDVPGPLDPLVFCTDPVNRCIRYQMNFTSRLGGIFDYTTRWLPEPAEDSNPFGITDSTSMNTGIGEYTVRVRSVDEFDVTDATPATVDIVGNFPPTLDNIAIENHDGTVVGDGGSVVWDWWNPANFHGSPGDTLDFSDPPRVWVVRELFFVVKGSGHDHPKEDKGGVKSWFYTFTRSDDPTFVQPFARSGLWVDAAEVNALCDTVRLTVRYSLFDDPGGSMAWEALPDWLQRGYDVAVRGRDTKSTDEFDQFMFVNGMKTLINRYLTAALGRETQEGTTSFNLTIVRDDPVAHAQGRMTPRQ